MGGGGYVSQGVDHGGKGNIAQAGAKALEHIREGYFQAGPQHLHIRQKPLPSGRDIRMLPQTAGHGNAAVGIGNGTGCRRAVNAPARAPKGQGNAKKRNGSLGIDEQKV